MSKSKSATALTPTDRVDWTDVPLQRIEYDPAAAMFAQGDPATGVMYMDSGAVRLSVVSHAGIEAMIAAAPADRDTREAERSGGVMTDDGAPSQSEALEMRADHLVTFAGGVFEPSPFQHANSSISTRDQP